MANELIIAPAVETIPAIITQSAIVASSSVVTTPQPVLPATPTKDVILVRGNYAVYEGNKGNFVAYDTDGTQYHLPLQMMTAKKLTTNELANDAMPLHGKANWKLIGYRTSTGELAVTPTGEFAKTLRLEVTSIFTRAELIALEVSKQTIGMEIMAQVNAVAKALNLSDTQMEILARSSAQV